MATRFKPLDQFEVGEYERRERTFHRFHALIRAGYVPDQDVRDCDEVIWFKPLARDSPELMLSANGVVTATFATINPSDSKSPSQIENDGPQDDAAFDAFIKRLPKPTLRDRTRPARHRYLWHPIGVAMLAGGWIIVPYLLWKFLAQ